MTAFINDLEMGKGEMNLGCFPSILNERKVITMDSNVIARRFAIGKSYAFIFGHN